MRTLLAFICAALPAFAVRAADIRGDYVESRTADVFTGPCFSNAEVFIYGKQAVMAWKVRSGTWKGVDLSGMCVAAAVRGGSTFSEDNPADARSVLIVDKKATSAQREALVSLAKELGGERLSQVVEVRVAHLSLKLEEHAAASGHAEVSGSHAMKMMPQTPRASFWAAGLAKIVTRPLDERDHACGNEVIAYPPLSKGVDVKPAYTLTHAFQGDGLEDRWDDANCRGSFVGHFTY